MSSNIHIINQFPLSSNKYFENVAKLKYFGMMATYKNCIPADIKIGLKWPNVSYHSVQGPFCSWSRWWLAGGESLPYRKLHAVGRDQKVMCATKFQFCTFCSTILIAHSKTKWNIKSNKGSPCFRPFTSLWKLWNCFWIWKLITLLCSVSVKKSAMFPFFRQEAPVLLGPLHQLGFFFFRWASSSQEDWAVECMTR